VECPKIVSGFNRLKYVKWGFHWIYGQWWFVLCFDLFVLFSIRMGGGFPLRRKRYSGRLWRKMWLTTSNAERPVVFLGWGNYIKYAIAKLTTR
jgi:hypothetical protein